MKRDNEVISYFKEPLYIKPLKRTKKKLKKKKKEKKKAQKQFLKALRDGKLPIDATLNFYGRQRQTASIPPEKMRLHRNWDSGVHFGRDPFGDPACYIGKSQEDDGHILVLGSPGTHKTTGIILQTLLTWLRTFVATDVKGDIADFCRKHRRDMRYPTKFIDFADVRGVSYHYNPFLKMQQGDPEELVSNAREIALAVIPMPNDIREPFWRQGAQNIFTAAIIYAFESGFDFNDTVDMILTTPAHELCEAIQGSGSIEAKWFINQFPINKSSADKTLQGCYMELVNHLTDFTHEQVKKIFSSSGNTIDWSEDISLCNVVISIPESKLDQWSSAVRLMLSQLLTTLTNRPDKYSAEGQDQEPLLLVFDEAPRLGKLEVLPHGLATLRSRDVTILLAIQSLAQLDYIYSPSVRSIIMDCCNYKIITAINDAETHQYFSNLAGTVQTWTPGISENYHPSRGELSISRQISGHREPIIYPHEFATMEKFVVFSPYGNFTIEKDPFYMENYLTPYWSRENFRNRLSTFLDEENYYDDPQRTYSGRSLKF